MRRSGNHRKPATPSGRATDMEIESISEPSISTPITLSEHRAEIVHQPATTLAPPQIEGAFPVITGSRLSSTNLNGKRTRGLSDAMNQRFVRARQASERSVASQAKQDSMSSLPLKEESVSESQLKPESVSASQPESESQRNMADSWQTGQRQRSYEREPISSSQFSERTRAVSGRPQVSPSVHSPISSPRPNESLMRTRTPPALLLASRQSIDKFKAIGYTDQACENLEHILREHEQSGLPLPALNYTPEPFWIDVLNTLDYVQGRQHFAKAAAQLTRLKYTPRDIHTVPLNNLRRDIDLSEDDFKILKKWSKDQWSKL